MQVLGEELQWDLHYQTRVPDYNPYNYQNQNMIKFKLMGQINTLTTTSYSLDWASLRYWTNEPPAFQIRIIMLFAARIRIQLLYLLSVQLKSHDAGSLKINFLKLKFFHSKGVGNY